MGKKLLALVDDMLPRLHAFVLMVLVTALMMLLMGASIIAFLHFLWWLARL